MSYQKLTGLFTFLILVAGRAFACEVCQQNQPRALKNISHGTGPQGGGDYIIIWSAALIVTVTLVLSLKFLIKPDEKQREHIKNIVVEKHEP